MHDADGGDEAGDGLHLGDGGGDDVGEGPVDDDHAWLGDEVLVGGRRMGRGRGDGHTGPDDVAFAAEERWALGPFFYEVNIRNLYTTKHQHTSTTTPTIEHLKKKRKQHSTDPNIPIQPRRNHARNETDHIPDVLPRLLAHALVREREGVLALEGVDEEAVHEVDGRD